MPTQDQRRFDLMVELRTVADEIPRLASQTQKSYELSYRLIRATDRVDALIKEILYQ